MPIEWPDLAILAAAWSIAIGFTGMRNRRFVVVLVGLSILLVGAGTLGVEARRIVRLAVGAGWVAVTFGSARLGLGSLTRAERIFDEALRRIEDQLVQARPGAGLGLERRLAAANEIEALVAPSLSGALAGLPAG